MLGSIYVGMSGLVAHAKGLQTISHNVANLNSPGYKAARPRFADLHLGVPLASTGPGVGTGGGVRFASSTIDYNQGGVQASSGQLDLAVQGRGFIPVSTDTGVAYMRTGQFTADDTGHLIERNTGAKLLGWSEAGGLMPVSISGRVSSPPQETSSLVFGDNLSSGANEFSVPNVDIFDAAGTKHTVTIQFKPDNQIFPGRWAVTVLDADDRALGGASLQFLGGIPEIGMDVLDVELALPGGASHTVSLDFSQCVTNFSAGSYSSLRVRQSDGHGHGEISSMRITQTGHLELAYANGQTQTLDAIALAVFNDPQQLEQAGQGLFRAAAGAPARYAPASDASAGRLLSGSTEASNVDLSGEFGRLILMQRGFQASSQVVSTANEMIMQLFQMRGQG